MTQGQRPLRRRAILLRAGCPGEACVIAASGSLKLPGSKRVYRLASKPRRLARGRSATFSLKLSKPLRRALKRAFASRGRASARLTVRAVDLAGNVTRKRVSVRLSAWPQRNSGSSHSGRMSGRPALTLSGNSAARFSRNAAMPSRASSD